MCLLYVLYYCNIFWERAVSELAEELVVLTLLLRHRVGCRPLHTARKATSYTSVHITARRLPNGRQQYESHRWLFLKGHLGIPPVISVATKSDYLSQEVGMQL